MAGSEDEQGNGGTSLRGVAIAAAIAILLLLVGLVFRVSAASQARDEAATAERHAYNIMLIVRGVSGSMARSEAALSRFVLNGDQSVGTLYYDEWLDANAQLQQLKRLTRADDDQAQLVAGLDLLFAQRGQELADVAGQAAYRRGWQALKLFNKASESRTVPSIARSLAAIEAGQRAILRNRSQQSEDLTSEANGFADLLSLTGVLLVLAAIGLGFATAFALAERRRADDLTDAEIDRSYQLETAVLDRTRELSEANRRLEAEMTERAAAEAQLRQAQKMDAVGRLTGGIAHDFNNMLAVVVGGLELARRRLENIGGSPEVTRQLDAAMEGAERAAALTRRLLGFARAEPLLPEGIDASRLVEGMHDLLDRTLGERIRVEISHAPEAWAIFADKHQLENAILNLAVNARDAMEGEGRLLIDVGNVRLSAHEIGEAPAGDYVRIAVEDSGAGMTPEVLERVFEPFFTTKPTGQGTGLGLSQIFGFVRESRGEIAIRTAVGEGTVVSLYLPRHAGPALVSGPPQPIAETAPRRAEPILLVEDDARVLAATCAALEELGYVPLACDNGADALVLLDRRPDVRLLISDLVMPGMTGAELVAEAKRRWPHLGALYVSGFVGEGREAEELAGGERSATRSPGSTPRRRRARLAHRAARNEPRQQADRAEDRPAPLPRPDLDRGARMAIDLPGEIIEAA